MEYPQAVFDRWVLATCIELNRRRVKATASWTPESLLKERGDEPMDVYNLGDTPAQYATFLELEYQLYPAGE